MSFDGTEKFYYRGYSRPVSTEPVGWFNYITDLSFM